MKHTIFAVIVVIGSLCSGLCFSETASRGAALDQSSLSGTQDVQLREGINDVLRTMLIVQNIGKPRTGVMGASDGTFDPWEPATPSNPSKPGNWWDSDNPTDPVDPWAPWPFPGSSGTKTSGAANIIATKILLETLKYYGVRYSLTKNQRGDLQFKVIESKRGYYLSLTNDKIAYAVKEMSGFLVGQMCNDPSPENLYKLFVQVPPGKLGVRFMYDMAWALLENSLPKDPSKMLALNSKWKVLADVINESGPLLENEKLSNISRVITTVLNSLYKLGKLRCIVDVTPDPRYEYVKRNVVNQLLKLQREIDTRPDNIPDVVNEAEKKGAELRTQSLKTSFAEDQKN